MVNSKKRGASKTARAIILYRASINRKYCTASPHNAVNFHRFTKNYPQLETLAKYDIKFTFTNHCKTM